MAFVPVSCGEGYVMGDAQLCITFLCTFAQSRLDCLFSCRNLFLRVPPFGGSAGFCKYSEKTYKENKVKSNQIMVVMPTEVPGIDDFADINSIDIKLTEYVDAILKRINMEDISGWRLKFYVNSVCTDLNGVGRKFRRYPSDKEYEIPIAISIPDSTQSPYGMSPAGDGKIGFFIPLNQSYYRVFEPEYDKFKSLDQYIFESAVRAINLGFAKGFTCQGKKIKFQNG